ncbi:MAG: DUF547 domain-containing protein [Woeseiaceae bacterium]|nr:DUF547 domain-containing protein [Woeseiaceae bacterium]
MWIKVLTVLAAGIAVLVVLVCAFVLANRPVLVTIDADIPAGFPENAFSHEIFEDLLHKYVDAQGAVDFEAWHANDADRLRLDGYLAAIAAYSPDVTPERFARQSDELAYWMYAYNAYVIRSVLDHWPLESVTDVKAPIEAVTGLGFFYRQRFLFGDTPLSLYVVENHRIRKRFQDPRIHFVLYCASASCPVLRPQLPTGDELETLLDEATAAFVSDPKNVFIDHENRQIVLSAIFEMYRGDFLRELAKQGIPSERGVYDYVLTVAPGDLRKELEAADGYEVTFAGYDWAIAKSK